MPRGPVARTGYRRSLRATLASQGAAYGFTLVVWASGAFGIIYYAPLTPWHVFFFVSGPVLMYATLLALLYRPDEPPEELTQLRSAAFGFMDFVSVPIGIAVTWLVYHLTAEWLPGLTVGSFLGTLVYNLILATQVLVLRGSDGTGGSDGS